MKYKSKLTAFTAVLCLTAIIITNFGHAAQVSGVLVPKPLPVKGNLIKISVNPLIKTGVLKPVENTMCVWDFRWFDDNHTRSMKDGWLKMQYPYLDYLLLMTFTGGREYNNWYTEDKAGKPSYNFGKPIEVLKNVIRGGLKPFIVLGNMPNDLATSKGDTGDSNNWSNRYPPKDWDKYYNYIKAFARKLVTSFGKSEIKKWKFRVGTEMDNPSWWVGTFEEWLKLYDYTVDAMQSEIGRENLYIGPANLMDVNNLPGLLKHFARGKNYYTGKTGTQCDFLSASYYDNAVSTEDLPYRIDALWDRAREYPELNIKDVNIGEGGLIMDKLQPPHRLHMAEDATEAGASWHASAYMHAQDGNLCYIATWAYYAEWNSLLIPFTQPILKLPSHNVNEALHKMDGTARVKVVTDGYSTGDNEVLSIASVDKSKNKLYILIFNHNSNVSSNNADTVDLSIRNIKPVKGNTVNVAHWRVDRNNSNFVTQWLSDSKNIPRIDFQLDFGIAGSRHETAVQMTLDSKGLKYWNSRKKYYSSIDDLKRLENYSVGVQTKVGISKRVVMPEHSVSVLEVSNVQIK